MKIFTSKLTKKYQATIPKPVRQLLQLRAGDTVAFDIKGKKVNIRKAFPTDLDITRNLEETLSEWASVADDEAYREL